MDDLSLQRQAEIEAKSEFARLATAALKAAYEQARIDYARYGLKLVDSQSILVSFEEGAAVPDESEHPAAAI